MLRATGRRKRPEPHDRDPGPSQEKVVRPPVGNTQSGLPEEYATKPPRAADTPNLANRKIKRLISELPQPTGQAEAQDRIQALFSCPYAPRASGNTPSRNSRTFWCYKPSPSEKW